MDVGTVVGIGQERRQSAVKNRFGKTTARYVGGASSSIRYGKVYRPWLRVRNTESRYYSSCTERDSTNNELRPKGGDECLVRDF